jgi:lipopolysaccharide transport system permease protein
LGGPLVLMVLYALMYGLVLRVQPASMSFTTYILYVAAGLIPFLSFSGGISSGAMSLSKDKQILLNTFFPSEFIGARAVLVQSTSMAAGLAAAILLSIMLGHANGLVLLVPFIILLQVLFTVAVVWILSLVTLALRDVQHVIQYVLFSLLVVTPIGYDRALVPPVLEWLMYFNPLYYFVVWYQDLIVFGRLPILSTIAISVIGSLVAFCGSYALFQRAKNVFYDYV